jgi:hypothetical protein
VFSSPPHRCAAARAKSTIPEGSTKTDTHAGTLSLAGGALEPSAIDVHWHPKVSESRSPRHHDAVGEDHVEFGEQEHQ